MKAPALIRRTQADRSVKQALAETPHPSWVEVMLEDLADDWNGVLESPLFRATVEGKLPEQAWRRVILDYFGIVEAFPRFMGVCLGRTTFGRSDGDTLARDWLIGSIRKEALYVEWFIDWGVALGLSRGEIIAHRAGPEFAALRESLWSVAHRGSLAEAVAAINYAVEGVTGDWARLVVPAFRDLLSDDRYAVRWLSDQEQFNLNPGEALELVKIAALDHEHQDIKDATRLALQLLRRGFDACFADH